MAKGFSKSFSKSFGKFKAYTFYAILCDDEAYLTFYDNVAGHYFYFDGFDSENGLPFSCEIENARQFLSEEEALNFLKTDEFNKSVKGIHEFASPSSRYFVIKVDCEIEGKSQKYIYSFDGVVRSILYCVNDL